MENSINESLGLIEPAHQSDNNSTLTQESEIPISQAESFQDIRIIRRWVQFFGWLTIVSMVITVISLLVMMSK